MQNVQIGSRSVGPSAPAFIIAEVGVNHNGDIAMARSLIDVAVSAGADAVKFQTFKAETLVTSEAPKADYQLSTTNQSESQLEMLKKLELSVDAHRELQKYCDQRSIIFLSTPFDEESADFLDSLNVPAFKISSGDLTNSPLLQHIGLKGKPVILSTGMSEMAEVIEAVSVLRSTGCENPVLLHCVSNYPADPAEVNLRAIATMRDAFGVPIGFSDHTQGIEISLAAVALGACVIEKHLTLDTNLPGPDHRASLDPVEFTKMVHSVRKIESALGNGRKVPTQNELKIARVARRSLVTSRDIQAGTILRRDMLVFKRPGTGLSPAALEIVLGRRTRNSLPSGTVLQLDMLESTETAL